MRWRGGRRSDNIEDRRGMTPIGRGLPMGGRTVAVGGGCGTLAVLIILFLLGVDPSQILQLLSGVQDTGGGAGLTEPPVPAGTPPPGDEAADFVSSVLASTEDTWEPLLAREGVRYERPHLVLFTNLVRSACGMSSAASGPFYCPED